MILEATTLYASAIKFSCRNWTARKALVGARVSQTNRLHGAETQRVDTSPGKLFDRQAGSNQRVSSKRCKGTLLASTNAE